MTPDPRWLEILKASGWQTTAIAAACGLFLLFAHWQWLQRPEPWIILFVSFAGILCGCLALASWGSAIYNFFPIHKWFLHQINIVRSKRKLRDYIPHMTPKEKEIIAFLLAKNQKTFTAAENGGHAATLLSQGFVIVLARSGQPLDPRNVPMAIPDPLWDVLVSCKDCFPYDPPQNKPEVHPWRVNWMRQ